MFIHLRSTKCFEGYSAFEDLIYWYTKCAWRFFYASAALGGGGLGHGVDIGTPTDHEVTMVDSGYSVMLLFPYRGPYFSLGFDHF